MSAIQYAPSRVARTAIKDLLAERFNTLLASACEEFDAVDQAFVIDYDVPGATFFESPYTFQDLQSYIGDLAAVQTLSTKTAVDEHGQFPTSFDGPVTFTVETFLQWPCTDTARLPDTEMLCDAVEAALVELFASPEASPIRMGSLVFDRGDVQFVTDNNIWYRSVVCTAEFHVTL